MSSSHYHQTSINNADPHNSSSNADLKHSFTHKGAGSHTNHPDSLATTMDHIYMKFKEGSGQ